MGRRPCCEKMGMKKGPWSVEEDQILINYINLHGHPNWRALPKLAGLVRCGKSCRLRWINYLKPDIKRGNFTPGEEETIINLHQILGNRWSAIAARLPGRTDNEIKNVWHTHLKKRLINNNQNQDNNIKTKNRPASPSQQQSSSSTSISVVTTTSSINTKDSATSCKDDDVPTALIDESFWSEVIPIDCNISSGADNDDENKLEIIKIENWEGSSLDCNDDTRNEYSNLCNDDMEFWFDLLSGSRRVGEISDDISEF